MLFPLCPLTARDRHQGKLIPPVKHNVIVRAIVTVGPLSPSCRAVSGRPARHPDRSQPESARLGQPDARRIVTPGSLPIFPMGRTLHHHSHRHCGTPVPQAVGP